MNAPQKSNRKRGPKPLEGPDNPVVRKLALLVAEGVPITRASRETAASLPLGHCRKTTSVARRLREAYHRHKAELVLWATQQLAQRTVQLSVGYRAKGFTPAAHRAVRHSPIAEREQQIFEAVRRATEMERPFREAARRIAEMGLEQNQQILEAARRAAELELEQNQVFEAAQRAVAERNQQFNEVARRAAEAAAPVFEMMKRVQDDLDELRRIGLFP
jgi:FAD/FMN-containing dehydrogenase